MTLFFVFGRLLCVSGMFLARLELSSGVLELSGLDFGPSQGGLESVWQAPPHDFSCKQSCMSHVAKTVQNTGRSGTKRTWELERNIAK